MNERRLFVENINLTKELSQLLIFTSRVAVAIRLYSNYGDPNDPNGPEDVRVLSDCLHNFNYLSSGIIECNKVKAISACDFLIKRLTGDFTHPAFKRKILVLRDTPIPVLMEIKAKLEGAKKLSE